MRRLSTAVRLKGPSILHLVRPWSDFRYVRCEILAPALPSANSFRTGHKHRSDKLPNALSVAWKLDVFAAKLTGMLGLPPKQSIFEAGFDLGAVADRDDNCGVGVEVLLCGPERIRCRKLLD